MQNDLIIKKTVQPRLFRSLSFFILLSVYFIGCTSEKDSVQIGDQTWMTQNLDVDKFRNGDPIKEAKTKEEWLEAAKNREPAWCYHELNEKDGDQYGKLYNYYAVMDPRGLAPEGWHIPSAAEFRILVGHLGCDAANMLKSESGWGDNVGKFGGGNNESGFNAKPGGERFDGFGRFDLYRTQAKFWTSTIKESLNYGSKGIGFYLMSQNMKNYSAENFLNYFKFDYGAAVRCVKNYPSTMISQKSNNSMASVKIGEQTWTSQNLNVATFRNGDSIPVISSLEEWEKAFKNKTPACRIYENDPINEQLYGRIYNYYAITDPRGLAPAGWHVPTNEEWEKLGDFLGGNNIAGKKLKSTSGWGLCSDGVENKGMNGDNSTGFSALPGGWTAFNSYDQNLGETASFWSTTTDNRRMYGRDIGSTSDALNGPNGYKKNGCYVRLVKD